jgi:hypothetical protein
MRNFGFLPTVSLGLFLCVALSTNTASAETQKNTLSITASDKKTGCTLSVPQMFATKPVTAEQPPAQKPWGSAQMLWSGACKNKRATGNGVARMMSGSRVIGTWYGDAKDGAMTTGVIEDRYGYEAGTFVKNRLTSPQDMAAERAAIERAKIAADALAKSFKKSGNIASAKYYSDRIDAFEAMALGE